MSKSDKDILKKAPKKPLIKDDRGRFIKGVSGNPKGRPLSPALTEKEREQFQNSAEKALYFLLNTAKTRTEALKIAETLMEYEKPKKKSVQSDNTTVTKIQIEIVGIETKDIEKVISSSDYTELPVDKIQQMVDNRIKEIDSGFDESVPGVKEGGEEGEGNDSGESLQIEYEVEEGSNECD